MKKRKRNHYDRLLPIENGLKTINMETQRMPASQFFYSLEKVFACIAILAGSLLIFLTPPIAVSDEGAHFINSYAISKGDFFYDVQDGMPGLKIPQSYVNFVNEHMRYCGQSQINEKYSFSQYINDSWEPTEATEVFHISSQRMINPVGYLVSGLGMAVGRGLLSLFSPSRILPYNLLLFGRIFNLLFYIIVTYQAIKITPIFKRTMLVIALMPMSIFQAASLSYDAIIIPVSMLFFAYATKLITFPIEYKLQKKDIIAVLFAAFFLGGIKSVYLPFLLILLAIPFRRFKSKKRLFQYGVLLLIVVFISYGIPTIRDMIYSHQITLNLSGNSNLQKHYLGTHITQIPEIFFNTLKSEHVYYFTSFFGELGWLGKYFPAPIIPIFYLVLLFVMVTDACQAKNIAYRVKILCLVADIIAVTGVFAAMYISWTSEVVGIGANFIAGVQGRYFIPITLFVCILMSNSLVKEKYQGFQEAIQRKADAITIYTPIICCLLTIVTIIIRFR